MPLIFTQQLDHGYLGLWKIEEDLPTLENGISYRSSSSHQEKRIQQTAARQVLNHLHPDFPFREVISLSGVKPGLPGNSPDFSISHTTGFAAAVIGKASIRVGVDIERISSKALRVSSKFMNDQEFMTMRESEGISQESFATLIWSIKESVFKWWGKGAVDFAGMIRVIDLQLDNKGSVRVKFLPAGMDLEVHFLLYDDLWITHLYAMA